MKKSYKREYEALARIDDAVKETQTLLNAERAEKLRNLTRKTRSA